MRLINLIEALPQSEAVALSLAAPGFAILALALVLVTRERRGGAAGGEAWPARTWLT
jgi:hypothetical protein